MALPRPPPALHRAATPALQDYLEASAAHLPDKVALVTERDRVTYGALDAQANALAHALLAEGVARGDRVIIFGDNTTETAVGFWAALKANAVACVVNPQTRAEKLAYYLKDSRAVVLLSDMELARVVNEAAAHATHLRRALLAGSFDARRLPSVHVAASWSEAVTRGAQLAAARAHDAHQAGGPPARRTLDVDLASIIYTSGSTGDPKGVMLSHRNMLTAATSISTYLELREDDVVLGVLPLSFDYGLYQMIMSFRLGARLVLERSFAYPAQVLARMAEEKVTGLPGVPTVFAVLADLKNLADFDLSSLRFVTNTAAALPVKHLTRLRQLFPQARLYSMYGLTECKRCTYLPPEDLDRKPTTVGIAIPDTELWLVDEHDRRVGPGVVGQLVIRGATVMQGYWEKPEATAERLKPGPLPGERVLYTGDLCVLDDEGYLTFVGRMDDIIKSRGEKVPPKEVECAIANLPGVREVAVIGVPDELLGQAVKAFVVLEEGQTLSAKDVLRECQKRLEPFMVPREVEFRGALPKSPNGKIRKAGLA
ncbi:MAG: AMP-binding protein [Myxococcaceae bacterium]